MDAIAKATDVPYKPMPGGQLVKFNLQDADLAELVNHISGLTGKRFIYGPRVRQIKVTVVSPTPVSLGEAYEAFLAILQANGMTVVPHGRFLKIVDTGGVVAESTPVYSRAAPVPETASFVTRLYRLKNVSPTEVSTLLQKFKSKEGDISVYEPGQLLIMTDSGENIQRMVRLIEEVDVGGENAKMWIEPIHYGKSGDIAKQINDIFELGGPGGAGGGKGAEGLMRVSADEQTNSLVVVGSEDAYTKLLDLLRRIDTAPAAEGRIHVLELQHAVAEELAAVLTQMLAGTGQKGGQGNAIADMFEGEVRVTPDKATNSLIITSSARDYAQLRLVIAKLDMPRRQVFIEAVIMDVSIDRSTDIGLAYHGGFTENLGGGSDTIFVGGFRPLTSVIPGPNELQGLALGVRGPDLEGTQNAFPALAGVSIPAFGVILNAIAHSGDANILATPHIIATDNVSAEINVGENIPLQENFPSLGSLGSLSSLLPGATGGAAANTGLSALSGLGGLGALGGFGSSQRQDVGTKIKVTPHINDKNQVRLEIDEEISERGAASGTLGAVSITQRNATTTLVVDDQQTVVIGGLMRDTLEKSRDKIPVLGDLPVLGFLFRTSHVRKRKTNLLLILTPYVILDQNDLRKVFERKMQERQEFLDRYFVFTSDWEPPKDFSRTNGLVEEIRQAYFAMEERERLEAESKPGEVKEHVGTVALELPSAVRISSSTQAVSGGGRGAAAPAAAPAGAQGGQGAQGQQPQPRRRRREGDTGQPGGGGGAQPGAPTPTPGPGPVPSPGLQRPGGGLRPGRQG